MTLRRVISKIFICLIFLSSGSFAESDFLKVPVDHTGNQTQLSEDTEDTLPEFRQTFKVNLSQSARTRPQSFQFELTSLFYRVGIKQYLYRQKLSSSTNEKLFIDFRTLLI